MTSREEWNRASLQPLDIPVEYPIIIWIAASVRDGHTTGATSSACTWMIRYTDKNGQVCEKVEAWPGRPIFSSVHKGYVAAVAGALDRLPAGSKAILYCRQDYIVNAINGDLDRWHEDGELQGPRARRKNAKVWQHAKQARDRIVAASGSVSARAPATSEDAQIIERLLQRARASRPMGGER